MAAPPLTATAPAKINLTLDVLRCRSDGYHELRSLVVGVDLRDQISCRAGDSREGIQLGCSDRSLQDDSNLAYLAAMKFSHCIGREPAVEIKLDKRIPIGAGLGGGSSDAATTLRLCDELFKTGLDHRRLAAIGAEVGSDVPLFFSLPSAVMTGRGEQVEPVSMAWSGWVLLAFPGTTVSTAQVYSAWRPADTLHSPGQMDRAITQAETANDVSALLSNQLEPAVFRVSATVARAYEELNRARIGPMRVSGAGSALYRLFDEKETACRAARQVEALGMGITTSVVKVPAGPGPIVGEEE